ncbi:hypothetical protein BABINDRAFT_30899 [Babjeviella inositovora NRRL Y-12698]|uniref:tRNA dimethylallyltransferase n=1 Tax=Babjeviella inositovora NRRL Y-12698 TaxID=984486 RepID=A0A1E3QYC3_9ASCO|nr:uncharacterized protein BABINDRAFT_30899 [Babjeviella inositovora NRRL Y-12698]ODQ82606.1 hypothetical protein BABINDRAFT_30899 [Babjeviella inositovora NRRL Y-12698]
MIPRNDIIAVVGTTGVGKSQLSIELAKKYNGEVINADSMQMYRGVPIITNKHPIPEREGVKHHVMNHVDWNEEYFVHRFKDEATAAIADIHARGKIPIVVGGTHYYLQSLLFHNKMVNRETEIQTVEELTQEEKAVVESDPATLWETLKKYDPVVAEKFHPNDSRKLKRALEIYFTTNRKASDIYSEQKVSELDKSSLRYDTLIFWVYSQTQPLEERLDSRVDKMLETGGLAEVRELYDFYTAHNDSPSPLFEDGIWQVIGFKEFFPWLKSGQKNDVEFRKCVDEMKQRTKKYAKQQVKWIRKKLVPEMGKEKLHNYERGGRVYLLDASDLDKWSKNVSKRGVEITDQFLKKEPTLSYAPAGFENMLEVTTEEFTQDKWKHFVCEVCTSGDGKPLVLVGEGQYDIHMKSRKHSSRISQIKRKKELEEFLAKRQKKTEAHGQDEVTK